MTSVAVYALSADPITFGHINLIERVSTLFDYLHVVIASNPNKSALLTMEEKKTTVTESVSHLSNVTVHISTGGYTVLMAQKLGAQVIVRGLRNAKDFDDEGTLAEMNRQIVSDIETLWLPSLPSLVHVSSSIVRGHIGVDLGWEKQVARLVPLNVLLLLRQKYLYQRARKHWMSLMEDLGNPVGSMKVYEALIQRYREPHRFYHTLKHIVFMLDEFEEVAHLANDPNVVRFGIWFHDVVQDTGNPSPLVASNEARSAYFAELSLAALGCDEIFIGKVCTLVEYTDHQKAPDDVDGKILLDLDLSIFGQDDEVFGEYEKNVRNEYLWVPEDIYKRKRKKILMMFLERNPIYYIDCIRDRYELKARNNLTRSIEMLS